MEDNDSMVLQKKRGDYPARGPILHTVEVRGKAHSWLIDTYITRENAQEWRDDGIEVNEVINRIPAWWVNSGLPVRWWCFWQDVFHFKNPWAK